MTEAARRADPMRGHVASLDGLRGLAILLVMMNHLCCITGAEPRTQSDTFFLNSARAGWCGVTLFFVLSGFLITGILADTKSSSHRVRNFYARRTLRIFPLYYGAVALAFWLPPALHAGWTEANFWPAEKTAWVWLYATNWGLVRGEGFGPMTHFWSLAVEEHFYLVWPWVIWWTSRETAPGVCVAGIWAAALSRALPLALGVSPDTVWPLDTTHLDSLCLGAWLALAVRGPSGSAPLVRPARWVAAGAFLALAGVVSWRGGMSPTDGMFQAFGFPPLVAFFGALVVVSAHAAPARPLGLVVNSGLLRFFGKYSYGLYVWHWLLSPYFDALFPAPRYQAAFGGFLPAVALHAGLSAAVTVLISLTSYHLYERPFLWLKRAFEAPPVAGNGR